MIHFLLCIALSLTLGIGYFLLYLKPKHKIEQFCERARKAGYKVKVTPYNPLSFFVVAYLKQDNRSLEVFKKDLNQYDLIVGNFFTKLAILPNHPNILKDLFNQSIKLHKNPFFINVFKLLADGGIPLAEGQEWKRKRKIVSSVFHFDFLNHMIPVIEAQTEKEMQKIDKTIKSKESVNLLYSCSRIFSSVIVKCFFGTDVNEYSIEGRPYCDFYLNFLNEITVYSQSFQRVAFGMTSYNLGLTKKARNLKKHIKIIYSIALQVIDKQLAKLKNGEFTQKNLLTTLYENNMLNQTEVHDPNKYTKAELIGQFFSFFGAGTDTTTNTVNLILHYLSEKKEYLEKINQQLEDVKELKGQQKLKSMKWTEAVINQTLRLGGPAASLLPRVVVEKITAGGLQIPQQTSLSIYTIMNQYKDEYFEKPFEFMPERWMQSQKIPPYAYIPFSAGERNCIGQYLARMESKIFIEKIVKKYNFKAKYPIKMHYEFVYATQHGEFQMEIKSQNNE